MKKAQIIVSMICHLNIVIEKSTEIWLQRNGYNKPYVIAEIGCNHMGQMNIAQIFFIKEKSESVVALVIASLYCINCFVYAVRF